MKINVNDNCYVKLTPAGMERFYQRQREVGMPERLMQHPNKVDGTEWCQFHVWDLMNTFGDMLYMGNPRLPFQDNVIIFGEQPNA